MDTSESPVAKKAPENMPITEVGKRKKEFEKEMNVLIAEKINAFESEIGTSSIRFELDVFHKGKGEPTAVEFHCYVVI